jgi:hypothetical protein
MSEISLSDLKKLTNIQLKSKERQQLLDELNGIGGLCHLLRVNPSIGLITSEIDDLKQRSAKFGINELLHKPPRSFIGFIWRALDDKLLLILLLCALITVVISISFKSEICVCSLNQPNARIVGKVFELQMLNFNLRQEKKKILIQYPKRKEN